MQQTEKEDLRRASESLISWFSDNCRDLPWRSHPSIYGTWLCEVIMQQTRIDQGIGYWHRFMAAFPTVSALADASESEVLKLWQGLGYYSRARNLHRAAQFVARDLNGTFPSSAEEWRKLPGVGPYTAAAVASMRFNEPAAAVDGNVNRVVARYIGLDEPVDRPTGKKAIQSAAEALLDRNRPGLHNEAMMELGALICSPKNPDCLKCPLQSGCASAGQKAAIEQRPFKQGKTKPKEVTILFHVITDGLNVVICQRPTDGIWGGLWEFPSDWIDGIQSDTQWDSPAAGLRWNRSWMASKPHILSHRKLFGQFGFWNTAGPSPSWPKHWLWVTWAEAESKAWPRMTERHWSEVKKAACEGRKV